MSTDPDQIRQQIEQTRSELVSDVDALTDRVDPRRIAGDRVGQARDALNRVKEKMMGTPTDGHGPGQQMSSAAGSMRNQAREVGQQAQGNPLAAGLIAFGAGMLVSALIPPSRPERQWAGQAKGMASQHAGELRQQASQVGHQMRDNLREPAKQAAQSLGSTAVHGASAVRGQTQSAAQQVQGQAKGAAGELRQG
ncbi:DUF3618 domain-containing protein [Micromonospora sp. DR5-3]|uniref:DUF3618 domain-containing protein n=1 Tax=unclassified Micromonospora TaxID=2617518 RepID=UPI0011DAC9A8|nr:MULTISPECIES: DUF3618 domain-containing protein [unclassified Micromonospora]MCW3819747.1 DUF3618 domain-containing protein [Micromonospora sp. DR5-3]TYC23324.1 DUF3618 domain-containing protein [Micromonospora sp. MP36]